MQNRYLAHYGVKGMRWGVRRAEKKAAREAANKRLKEMSDEELKTRLNRLNMEKQYRAYVAELNPERQSRVKKFVLDSIESGAKTLANAAFQKMAKNFFEKEQGDLRTNTNVKDPTKLGDKALEKYIKRQNSERVIADLLAKEEAAAKKSADDAAKLAKARRKVYRSLEKTAVIDWMSGTWEW